MKTRKSIWLKTYDYSSSGYYFVTICVKDRECLFGEIKNAEMRLNNYGGIVRDTWLKLPDRYTNVTLGQFVVMPNHFHGIIAIMSDVGAPLAGALDSVEMDHRVSRIRKSTRAGTRPAPTLGQIMGAYKSITTNEIMTHFTARNRTSFADHIWQRGYYDRIIRNENELRNTREYVLDNPKQWHLDPENPERLAAAS